MHGAIEGEDDDVRYLCSLREVQVVLICILRLVNEVLLINKLSLSVAINQWSK